MVSSYYKQYAMVFIESSRWKTLSRDLASIVCVQKKWKKILVVILNQ